MSQSTRELDKYKRQIKMLEMYVSGRIKQLTRIAKKSPGEAASCEMAESELQIILTQVVPQMREVQS
jgi:hypothetical protein